jgi:hypothetical protein
MKSASIFVLGFVLGLGIVAYTILAPADSPSTYLVLAGPDTERTMRGDAVRNVLFLLAASLTVAAVVMAFFKGKVAAILWGLVLLIIVVRTLLPSTPTSSFPFAPAVFWCGMAAQLTLCYSAFRLSNRKKAEPTASPNGGPASPVGDSSAAEGPPSVS